MLIADSCRLSTKAAKVLSFSHFAKDSVFSVFLCPEEFSCGYILDIQYLIEGA